MKKIAQTLLIGLTVILAGCGNTANKSTTAIEDTIANESTTAIEATTNTELVILAAASLTDVCDEIKTAYEAANEGVTLTFSFGGSGALQTQIEEGAPADVFISAATKQMTALDEKGFMMSETITNVFENKVVLIVPKNSTTEIASFEDVATDKVAMIGLGEIESVPVGQYSKEVFITLGLWEVASAKANYGSDVRTVLAWVEEEAVDCGVVYATDAYSTDKVKIVSEAPKDSCKQVIYPAGVIKSSANSSIAGDFVEYLSSDEAIGIFEKYGFTKAE